MKKKALVFQLLLNFTKSLRSIIVSRCYSVHSFSSSLLGSSLIFLGTTGPLGSNATLAVYALPFCIASSRVGYFFVCTGFYLRPYWARLISAVVVGSALAPPPFDLCQSSICSLINSIAIFFYSRIDYRWGTSNTGRIILA